MRKTRKHKCVFKKTTPDQENWAIDAYRNGDKTEYIAAALGVSLCYLSNLLNDCNIQRRKARSYVSKLGRRTLYWREWDRNRRAAAIAKELGYT